MAPRVILDTNVLIDIFTCGDLADEYIRTQDVKTERSAYRRARGRESLILAMHLHETRAATWSLPDESRRQVLRMAPPDQHDDPKLHFTWVFVNYVKDNALGGWNALLSKEGDEGLKGAECDDYLVHVAALNRVPLITNEGLSHLGFDDDHGIRGKAKAAGVRVYAPGDYWQGRINPRRASRRFIAAFRRNAFRFIRRYGSSRTLLQVFQWIDGYFHHILYGIAADRMTRLPVDFAHRRPKAKR
jgi:hypothetical protein